MEPEIAFFFYLGAVACFVLAALAQGGRAPAGLTRRGASSIGLVPLGLALFAFPTLWTTGELAF